FKSFLFISYVMMVIFGFFIALRYYNVPFSAYWLEFILVLFGSTTLVAGALTLNNWLEADVDILMERTKQRPTVTGTLSIKAILLLGVVLSLIGQGALFFVNVEVAVYGFIGWYTYVVV